ncbi:MAG: hypothetical protein HYS57_02380 [Parcubacteria group bacterium]|nr:hypothetical protein [Parcubacteria group bacterium]
MTQRDTQPQGFSLLEAIIVVGLVLVGMVPLVALMMKTVAQASFVQDQLVAANLAQEGIEIVRAIRDENWLNERSFASGFPSGGEQERRVHYKEARLLPGLFGQTLKFDASTGFYQYDTGVDTQFRRRIFIERDPAPGESADEIKIRSVVEWTTRGQNFSIEVEDHIFSWLPT